jgi:hypothetical protein
MTPLPIPANIKKDDAPGRRLRTVYYIFIEVYCPDVSYIGGIFFDFNKNLKKFMKRERGSLGMRSRNFPV